MGFTRNTQVLSENGWVDIFDIDLLKIWVGSEWVNHNGLLCLGALDVLDFIGLQCTHNQQFLASSGATGAGTATWVTPDYLALSQPSLDKAVRAARRLITPTYACRLQRNRPKPPDTVSFDIAGVSSYLVLSHRGPLVAKAEFKL